MNYALRSKQLLLASLSAMTLGFLTLFFRSPSTSGSTVEFGMIVFLVLWSVAPVLLYWHFLRFSFEQRFFEVAALGMLLGPVILLLNGFLGSGENALPLFFVPAIQWLLALPLGVWFASIRDRHHNDRDA